MSHPVVKTSARRAVLIVLVALVPSLGAAQDVCALRPDLSWSGPAPQETNPAPARQPAARRDSLWNGTLIGAGAGFATGFLGLAAYNAKQTASGPIWYGEAVGIYTSAGLVGAGIGAVIGAALDAAHKPTRADAARRVTVSPRYVQRSAAVFVTVTY
jgi:hypothetical protein